METLRALNDWLDNTKAGDKAFRWTVAILVALGMFFGAIWPRVNAQTVYGYINEGSCISDVMNGEQRGYATSYSDEFRLIAAGKHDYYQHSTDNEVCYEVPANLKQIATANRVFNIDALGVPVGYITVEGAAKIKAVSRAINAAATFAGLSMWEAVALKIQQGLPSLINAVVSIAENDTYFVLTDPCQRVVNRR